MGSIKALGLVLLGLTAGLVGVEVGLLDTDEPGNQACNAALESDGWTADLNASTDVDNGTRLVCVHDNGTRETVTVDVSVDVGAGGG